MSFLRKKYTIFSTYFKDLNNQIDLQWIEYKNNQYNFQKETSIPKIIWIYWQSATSNMIVDICLQQVQRICSDYTIHILNDDNIRQFMKLPDFSPDIPLANISDFIRLTLLAKFGGIWMDASIFLTENFDWILEKINGYDAFLFYTKACTTDLTHPISETWFILAPSRSPFILAWLEEFTKCIMSEKRLTFYEKLFRDTQLTQNLPKDPYLNCYFSAIVVLNKKKYNLLYACSESVGHYYNYKFRKCMEVIPIVLARKNKKTIFIPKLIKFTNDSRKFMNQYLSKSTINPNSLLSSPK